MPAHARSSRPRAPGRAGAASAGEVHAAAGDGPHQQEQQRPHQEQDDEVGARQRDVGEEEDRTDDTDGGHGAQQHAAVDLGTRSDHARIAGPEDEHGGQPHAGDHDGTGHEGVGQGLRDPEEREASADHDREHARGGEHRDVRSDEGSDDHPVVAPRSARRQ